MAYHPNIPTPTGVVQDELAQMRENFQHLAPLAQAVDELQAVSGLAQAVDELQAVSGLAQAVDELQAVSELAPYAQAILNSRIVEMGSNNNGEYVRWENGLQVCWHKVSLVFLTSSVLDGVWTYPAAFTAEPRVFHVPIHGQRTGASTAGQYANGVVQSLSNTSAVFRQHSIDATDQFSDGDILPVSAFAIGRWK